MKQTQFYLPIIVIISFSLTISIYSHRIQAAPTTDAVVGTGTAGSCTEATFDTALSAVQSSGGGTITFNCGGAVTIPFSSQKIITVQDVTLAGAGEITLSGNDVSRLFYIQTTGRLVLQEITLTDGYSGANYGGAIYIATNGELLAENTTIKDSATNGWAGGAIIDFNGTVTLVDSIVSNNQSSYGAINSIGTLTLIRTQVLTNTATLGGGALSVGGQVTIEDSTIQGNSGPVGGALFITSSGHVTISGSLLKLNEANGTILPETGGGAILNDGWLSVTDSTFTENVSSGSGAAIQNGYQTDTADTFLEGVTAFGNQAALYGGALYNQSGTASVINSTISENIAEESGGGISSYLGPTTVFYATLSYNQGGNLNQISEAGNQDSRQQIKVGNTAFVGGSPNCWLTGNPTPDPLPYFNTLGYNLADDTSCATYLTGTGDQNDMDAQLGPLTTNGGATLTQMPLSESPLIDTAVCSPDFLTDQRGLTRPQPNLCDIGAVEVASTPVTQILPFYYRLALDHLESLRGGSVAPNWSEEARLSLRAIPFYRPDLPEPAYYEFQVEVPGTYGYQPAGFIMVSIDPHDYPIPHWSDEAEAPSRMLLRKAGEQGNLIPVKFFRLDALAYAAEDATGGLASMSDSTFNKIIRPPGPLPTVELSSQTWVPETTPPNDDGNPGNITYNMVSEGPMTTTLELGGWASWGEIKSEYAATYGPYLDHLQDEANEAWLAVSGPIGLQMGDSYVLPLIDAMADVQLAGAGATLTTMEAISLPGGRWGVRLTITGDPGQNSVPFQVEISTPAEQVDFIVYPELNEIYLPLVTHGNSSSQTNSLISAPSAITGWGSWRHYVAGSGVDQRYYRQIYAHEGQNYTSCPSGCGATAWAMLFGWADHQAWMSRQPWTPRWGLYRFLGGYGANADAPGVMRNDLGVYNMIWEIRSYLGTPCVAGAGPTMPNWMADAQFYLFGRSYARIYTQYNIIGISEGRLMNNAADSIIFNHTPAIIGTGWLNHYPLAWGYSSRTYYYGLGLTRTERYFYVNQGWGTVNEWVSASTWFAGQISP